MNALASLNVAPPTLAPALPPAPVPASAPPPPSRPPRPIAEVAQPRAPDVGAATAPVTLATPVVVFGTGPRGGPCAGRFRACDAAFALAAGRASGLRVLRAGPEHAALIKPIKRGHLFGDGKAVLPAAEEGLIAALAHAANEAGDDAPVPAEVPSPDAGLAEAPRKPARGVASAEGEEGAGGRARPRGSAPAPAGGADGGGGLRVGALVLALDHETEGEPWFAARVERVLADGRARLRWRDFPQVRAFARPAEELAPLPLPFATAED